MFRILSPVLLLLPGLALAATAPPTATQILAEAKAASGGAAWNHVHSMRTKGSIKIGGLSGSTTRLEDLLTGRSVTHVDLGPIEMANGFDGKAGWRKLPNGNASVMSAPEAKKTNATRAYQTEHAWWYPKRSPAKIESLGTRKSGGKAFYVLRITPRGGNPFEMWINVKTHLIARFAGRSSIGSVTTHLRDYRTVDGVKMPFHARTVIGKEGRQVATQLKSVAVNVPVTAADFAVPESNTNAIAIVGGGDEATIPFQLINNHIHIRVKIDGRTFHFIVDSGGLNVLTPKAARAIGLAGEGALAVGGAGTKSVKSKVSKVKSLVLGGKITLHDQVFTIIPFPRASTKIPIDGTVGYGVFSDFVVRIDYAHQKLTFIRPPDFNASGAGTAMPISFLGQIPAVEGSLDGLSGLFLVDTGTGFPLILNSPFARTHHLYRRYDATPAFALARGYNGKAMARVARGGKLTIGRVTINNPLVALSTATKGALAITQAAGLLGGELFKRFTMTLDYANKHMYLKPNKNYGKPMNFNRSGMTFKQTQQGFVVFGIVKGGPAAQAGIQIGDVITTVNGRPASDINDQAFKKMLRDEAPGTKMKLTTGKGRSAHTVTITLRRLIPKTGGLSKIAPSPSAS